MPIIMPIIFGILGVFVGLSLGRNGGWAYAGMVGFVFGLLLSTRSRLAEMEREVAALKQREVGPVAMPESPTVEVGRTVAPVFEREISPAEPEEVVSALRSPPPETGPAESGPATSLEAMEPHARGKGDTADFGIPGDPATPSPGEPAWLLESKRWMTGGNIMVRAGVVVLFFGVAFLLKFAADNALLPIEFRLAGVAAGGIAMLLVGWRLRSSKRAYGLVLQGGAVGVLYLTIFAALRLYALVPPGMAFGLLLVFATFSAVLALLQDARALAILGAGGGFLAPILTSAGGGSHVHLFAYYVILNVGILGIAWFRAWRLLNLVGFAFTFIIAGLWGAKYYRPIMFETTEPFLIIFALMYVAISVLFALRQPIRLRGLVDGTLVFGVPLVAFGLQAGLLRESEYGLAYSALGAAAFYVVLAKVLFSRLGAESRLLAEAFLALGVGFATLSIPLALDAQWTAGSWALEGAGLVWIGLRQERLLPRVSGYLLQLGGGLALVYSAHELEYADRVVNGLFVGAMIVALAGLFSAWYCRRRADILRKTSETPIPLLLLIWGSLWWYGGWAFEFNEYLPERNLPLAFLFLFAVGSTIAAVLRNRIAWPEARYWADSLLPFATTVLLLSVLQLDHPFEYWTGLGWLAVFAARYTVLRLQDVHNAVRIEILEMWGLWLLITVTTWEAAWIVDDIVHGSDTWWRITLGLVPALFMFVLRRYGDRLPWPFYDRPEIYREKAMLPVGGFLWLWAVGMMLMSRGSAVPLTFVPLLNPMDIALGFVLLLLFGWLRIVASEDAIWRFKLAAPVFAMTLFLWFNSMWFRIAHHWLGIRFDAGVMLGSQTVQTGLALLWSICGLGCMVFGTRTSRRTAWLVGAGLMAVVVAKLFVVDLSNSDTVARVVSFMGVGGLLLVVGYFSPVPPRGTETSA